MKRLTFILALGLSLLPVCALAQVQPQSCLPDSFGPWTGKSAADTARQNAPAPGVLKEAGETNLEAREYSKGGKTTEVICEQFKDPTGAYGIFTAMLSPKLNPSTVGPLTAAGNDQLIALVGNRVITVSPIRSETDGELKQLLDAVKKHADSTPLPPIRAYLPNDEMVQGTQRYALGPAGFAAALQSLNESKFAPLTQEIGFQTGAEAMLARYVSAGNQTQALVLIEYPTPQLAEQRLHHIEGALAGHSELAGTTIERRGSLLSMVLSPVSTQAAAQLRDKIGYETSVTWNEPSSTLTDPPWLIVVKNIFVGTLAFCGIAVVVGVAFGGVRVLTKRLFPGKVFDRPEDMEVLQLGLTGKRIDPSDFY